MPNLMVSGIIPCYNHEDWVIQAITSMAQQDYQNLRIVFIDDGSTDNSWENVIKVCDNLDSKKINENSEPKELKTGTFMGFPIILARLSMNYGPSISRNYGIKTAWEGTDIFAFLDSDDYYQPGKIKKSIKYFEGANNLVGTVYSDYETENIHDGRITREFKEAFVKAKLLEKCIVNMDSLVSKTALEKAGLFDDSLRVCEDYDLHIRVSEHNMICHIPEPLVRIRVGRRSSTESVPKEKWEMDYRRVFQKLQERQNKQ